MSTPKDAIRCGAKTRSGGTCPNLPMLGRTRCRMHGGASLMGADLPQFKDGLRSRLMPTRLLARYQAALDDPDLLSIKTDVALLQSLIDDKLAAWAADQSGPNWHDVYEQVSAVNENFQTWEWTRAKREIEALVATVGTRRTEGYLLDEIRGLIDQKARLAIQEHKRMLDLDQVLTVEQAILVASALAAIVRDLVPDEAIRRTVNARVMAALSVPSRKEA